MEKIRDQAMFCVGRAVFFGYLAISMVMLGSMFDLVLFFRAGAILCVIMALILLWYVQTAATRKPEHTETWLLLDERHRPRNDHAIRIFAETLREVYAYFAGLAVKMAIMFGLASIACSALGIRYIFEI